jgi:hypothetical protein
MSIYDSLAVNDIRIYLWEKIKASGLMNESDYYADGFDKPLIPVIPVQQVPEFNNLLPGKPYIVFEWDTTAIQQNWWILDEVVTFFVNSPRHDEINSIMNFMVDLFRRYDDAATEIEQSTILSNNFIFHYTAINSVKSPSPSKHEGGIKTGYVEVIYSYSRITQDTGRF